MTSLFEPDPSALSLFELLQPFGEVLRRTPLQTHRLDDIVEIQHVDFLKIDVQGAELAVFEGDRAKLTETVEIQTEVSFVPLYEGQPCIGDIDLELRGQGFLPHCFVDMSMCATSPARTR